jgi:ferredoxin--NADP+ reductase
LNAEVGVGAEEYNGTFVEVRRPHADAMVFRVRPDAPMPSYEAGQWISIGIGMWEERLSGLPPEQVADEDRVKLLRRPLSISSSILADGTEALHEPEPWYELYASFPRAAAPPFTARLFALQPGARLWIADAPRGVNTLAAVQPDDDILFAATGTGEAPHNRMIWELLRRGHRGRIASFVSTRQRLDQAYRAVHERVMRLFPRYRHVAVVTGEGMPRLQAQLQSGALEESAGFALDPARARVFLCGNPAMIGAPRLQDDRRVFAHPGGMVELLEARGFHSDPDGGTLNIHFERY